MRFSDRYVIELPDLTIDINKVLDYAKSYQAKWSQWTSPEGITAPHSTCLLDDIDIVQHAFFFDLIDRLNPILNVTKHNLSIVKFPPNYSLPSHIDPVRKAAITIPIVPEMPAPIYWAGKNAKILYKHVYTHATVINVQRKHGVINDNRERITLQIDLSTEWNALLSLQKSKGLVK